MVVLPPKPAHPGLPLQQRSQALTSAHKRSQALTSAHKHACKLRQRRAGAFRLGCRAQAVAGGDTHAAAVVATAAPPIVRIEPPRAPASAHKRSQALITMSGVMLRWCFGLTNSTALKAFAAQSSHFRSEAKKREIGRF